jgi:hypothetical protein
MKIVFAGMTFYINVTLGHGLFAAIAFNFWWPRGWSAFLTNKGCTIFS